MIGPVTILPRKTWAPVASPVWIETLCGMPASWLLKAIVNALPAAALAVVVVYWTPLATIVTSAAGPAGAPLPAGGCPPLAWGAPLAAAVPPFASVGGMIP